MSWIDVISAGPGDEALMTEQARAALAAADAVFCADRHAPLAGLSGSRRPLTPLSRAMEEMETLRKDGLSFAVLLSGDAGLFSLLPALSRRFGQSALRVHPGVSSLQLLCARLGIPWQGACVLSAHGRALSPSALCHAVRTHQSTLLLLDGERDPTQAVRVTVGVTGGREMAEKTFNPRLGIQGGLSILGTTGVVRPMSGEALAETIRLEMGLRRAAGAEEIALVFGSQGEAALKALRPALPCVQMGNFVGASLDAAAEAGFHRVLLAGQPGKLVKVAGGCMQTHSRFGDGRRETLCAHLALLGAPGALLNAVMKSATLDGMIPAIQRAGYEDVWPRLCRAASRYARARARGALRADVMMLDGEGKVLGWYEDS